MRNTKSGEVAIALCLIISMFVVGLGMASKEVYKDAKSREYSPDTYKPSKNSTNRIESTTLRAGELKKF